MRAGFTAPRALGLDTGLDGECTWGRLRWPRTGMPGSLPELDIARDKNDTSGVQHRTKTIEKRRMSGPAMRVALKYAAFASLWIVFSDSAVALISSDLGQMRFYSMSKGLAFVLTTGLLLFFWVRQELREKNGIIAELNREAAVREQLIRELHHRIKNNLQVVMGLVNMSARECDGADEAAARIADKLHSLMAVFNVVYEYPDMRRISFSRVMEEYSRITSRRIVLEVGPADAGYSVETMTSLLLLVNAMLEDLDGSGGCAGATISLDGPGGFTMRPDGGCGDKAASLGANEVVIALLESVGGTLTTNDDGVAVRFADGHGAGRDAATRPGDADRGAAEAGSGT